MAKRPAKTRPSPSSSAASDEERLIDAALALAARQGWRNSGMGEIGIEAGVALDAAYAAFPSKHALLEGFFRRIDRAALAGPTGSGQDPPRDRLFDVLMRRFEALQPHRAALRAILRDSRGDPWAFLALPAVLRSMGWMLEAAGIAAAGWRGALRTHLLAGLYFSVLPTFLEDDTADLTRTMAALDRRLRRGESWLGLAGSRPNDERAASA